MRNLKLSRKLLLLALIIPASALLLGGIAFQQTARLKYEYDNLYGFMLLPIIDLHRAELSVEKLQAHAEAWRRFDGDASGRAALLEAIRADERTVGEVIEVYQTKWKTSLSAEFTAILSASGQGGLQQSEEETLARLTAAFGEYRAQHEAMEQGREGTMEGPLRELTAGFGKLVDLNLKLAEFSQESAHRAIADMKLWLLVGGLFATLGGLLFALWLSRLIVRPVAELARAADEAARGNLSVTVEVSGRDEVGSLSASFNTMIQSIQQGVDALAAEKATIQHRVDEAVQMSEEQRAYLARNVERMLVEMNRFAEGDLTIEVEAERDDEVGRLFDGFNRVIANLRDMLRQVEIAVESTGSASSEISASTDQLSAAAQEQSSQAAEVATSIEQMAGSIAENAHHASELASITNRNSITAREGGQVVGQTVSAIRDIAQVVAGATATVEGLGQRSKQVGEIVDTIHEIAEQTNLLALNAAIEAARAGEQGRGFAVVADEVRKLAERTRQATRDVAQRIRAIQAETTEAVGAMQGGRKQVDDGLRLADEAGKAFEVIVEGILSTEERVGQLAAGAEEQSATSEQITKSVGTIAMATQESAAGISQIARSTDDLNRLTENLMVLIRHFKIRKDSARGVHTGDGGGGSGKRLVPAMPVSA